jgi:hypothetical protein
MMAMVMWQFRLPHHSRQLQQCKRGKGTTAFIVTVIFAMMLQTASSFSITMKYQPPVKFSVNSLYGGRRSRLGSSSSNTPRKSAYAGTLSMPPFEQRMREMVLRDPKESPTAGAGRRRRALPKNVIEVESLQEYKEVVVGNAKIVVVRFHASYCKVRLLCCDNHIEKMRC